MTCLGSNPEMRARDAAIAEARGGISRSAIISIPMARSTSAVRHCRKRRLHWILAKQPVQKFVGKEKDENEGRSKRAGKGPAQRTAATGDRADGARGRIERAAEHVPHRARGESGE